MTHPLIAASQKLIAVQSRVLKAAKAWLHARGMSDAEAELTLAVEELEIAEREARAARKDEFGNESP
jgi:hypothetical protein